MVKSVTAARRGSALLIVLGMLAFMVISAVAFSAYMRSSRLPSSFLRRTVSSRLLVKAALARAIDEVDAAIGNNPHPGVGTAPTKYPRMYGASVNRNFWNGRVFIGTNLTSRIEQDETVPTLSLEGLAYIPPPLINEARYYSRHATSARWRSLPYDSGRYAFTAIDVSDFFDINTVPADAARSSFPEHRLTLSHLFEQTPDHANASGLSTPGDWDAFIGKFTKDQNGLVPLTSVADLNLALGNLRPTGWTSPFYEYVKNGGADGIYGALGTEESDRMRSMTFVTDGWFPVPDSTVGTQAQAGLPILDLSDERNQPFTEAELKKNAPNYYQDVTEGSSIGLQRLREFMPNVALAALWDYLDPDRIPVSLSIPTTERVPMVCSFDINLAGANLKVNEQRNPDFPDNKDLSTPEKKQGVASVQTTRVLVYTLDPDSLGSLATVKAVLAYPFRHHDGVPANFTVDGGLAFFLAPDGMGLRAGSATARLRYVDADKFGTAPTLADGVVLVPFRVQQLSFPQKIDTETEAVREITLEARTEEAASLLAAQPLLSVKYQWTQNDLTFQQNPAATMPWQVVDKEEPDTSDAVGDGTFCTFKPLSTTGAIHPSFTSAGSGLVTAMESAGLQVKLQVAVYIRVRLDNKTVDLVPAVCESDKMNGSTNGDLPESQITIGDHFGSGTPLMRFDTGAGFTFNLAGLKAAGSGAPVSTMTPEAVRIDDPRYNHAPESWYAVSAAQATSADWLANNRAKDNDGDIFMQVSDQGYLQSVYELANLPRFGRTGFYNWGNEERGNLAAPGAWTKTTFPAAATEAVNYDFMWRTYNPFRNRTAYGRGDESDGFEQIRMVSSQRGPWVNPYSDVTNIIMAAFANTPRDWRCASTNNQEQTFEEMSAQEFNGQYAWNSYSSGPKLAWEDLEDMASRFMDMMRNANPTRLNGEEKWEAVWRNLGWYAEGVDQSTVLLNKTTLSATLSEQLDLTAADKLYNTDKKFLYGFWHDCFAARQQLFLVFVRAEPSMMGGGAANQTPPQLGARAVALVWRNPAETSTAGQPHQTRILFYRQLD